MHYSCWGQEDGGEEMRIEMNGGVLWGRPRPGRGCSAIDGWMDNPSGRTMALGLTQPLTEMSTRNTSWGLRRPVRRADNLTTFVCRLSWNLGASTSWNPQGLSRPVMGLLYLYLYSFLPCHQTEASVQLHVPGRFTIGERASGWRCRGHWMGTIAGLGALEKEKKPLPLPRTEPRVLRRQSRSLVAIATMLSPLI